MMRVGAAVSVLVLVGCGSGGGGGGNDPPDCVDLGGACPAGFQCSLATRDCEAASETVRWTLNDQCNDGLGVQARFFDSTHGGQWPDPPLVWRTNVEGGFVDELLACIPGAMICYGAEPAPADGTYWGSGLDGNQACDACCVTCNGLDPPPINLRCD
jgi:hypothetical protein